MSTNSTFDEVDEYVDALLGETPPTPPVARLSDAGPGTGGESAPSTIVVEPPDPTRAAPGSRPEVTAPRRDASAVRGVHATTTAVAASPMPSLQTSHRWLRVAVESDSYALELLCVQEVVRVAPIVAMRGASRAVLGVMNLRGRIVPVFDLGLWLGTSCVEPEERSRIVVVERDDELIGVLVTLVEDVVTLGPNRIEPPLQGSAAGPIVGVARVAATPTVLLDAGALFANGAGN